MSVTLWHTLCYAKVFFYVVDRGAIAGGENLYFRM